MMNRHQEAFREEAIELLGELEGSLLELEKSPTDMDTIGRVFRAMHTIKGSGAMFGFDDIVALIHDVETVYDRIRNGKLHVTGQLVDLTLSVCDQVRRMIDNTDSGCGDLAATGNIIASFRSLLENADSSESAHSLTGVPAPPSAFSTKAEVETTYRIRFRPSRHIFSNGTNTVLLLQEVLELGSGRLVAQTEELPLLDDIDPEACYTYWDIILTTGKGINAIRDVFIFVEDDCELSIEEIGIPNAAGESEGISRLGEILIERGDISTEELQQALSNQKRIGEILIDSGLVAPGRIHAALAEQEHIKEIHQKKAAEQSSSIRVPAEKLDNLVNMVGELVTVQSRLSQIASESNQPRLLQVSEDVQRLVAELRDTTMSIRMLPIGTTFVKFNRLVRDLSGELGKEIKLITAGGETELDKTVIERLNDPLVHLIRNCIDHGIESPDIRLAQNKPGEGTITLSATHSGASVLIQIKDDGAGLNADSIRSKAMELGLIGTDAALTDRDLYALIFQPGFSTAAAVTSISGRGVGMDVVKRNIDALSGTIDISSQKGSGTTITLKLPLTLAIIDGLLVEIGEECFVMPLAVIEECVELKRDHSGGGHERNLAVIRGGLVPYLILRDLFQIPGTPPAIEQIVITQVEGLRVGFVVDQVIGQHQTVIKSLGRAYRNVTEISGATILGDGRVALILDLPRLVRKAEQASQFNRGLERAS
jgi:two-component system, chemotaxis family, sensor kinase CheA